MRVTPRWQRATFGGAVGILALAGAGSAAAAGAAQQHAGHAAAAPGSGLGSIDVSATATSVRFPMYSHNGEDVEAESPYALTTLQTGGVAYGLSSIMWPGATGAHGGDVLDLIGAPAPANVKKALNDPEKAEAQSSVGNPTVSKSGPGFSQTATAKATHVSAAASSDAKAAPGVGQYAGSGSASSVIDLTGPKQVVSTARSSVHDFSFAGVLKIGSVVSVAHATSNGKSATGTTSTQVSGASVAGVDVTIDANGVHAVKQQGKTKKPLLPLPNLPSPDTYVNQALKQSGISVSLTKPSRKIKGATASLDSGAVVVHFGNSKYTSQDNDTGNLLTLGGVTLTAATTKGFGTTSVIAPVSNTRTTSGSAGTAGTPGVPGTPGTAGTPIGSAPQVAPGTTGGPQSAALAAANFALPGGLRVWWVVLAALGSGLIAFGLKRLPDRVLEARGPACTLEDTTT